MPSNTRWNRLNSAIITPKARSNGPENTIENSLLSNFKCMKYMATMANLMAARTSRAGLVRSPILR